MATTRFVDIQALSALVRTLGVPRFLETLAQTRSREDFLRWPEFDKSARLASHSPLGVIELMPVSDATHYAFKYVNGHPANTARGLPTVMAFGVLAEVETGFPLLLAELTLTTALRTAAMSALAAQAVARPGVAQHGADRQRRPGRVPGPGLPRVAGRRRTAGLRPRSGRHRQAGAQPRRPIRRCACSAPPASPRPCAAPTS